MNSFAAAHLFENPVVLVALAAAADREGSPMKPPMNRNLPTESKRPKIGAFFP